MPYIQTSDGQYCILFPQTSLRAPFQVISLNQTFGQKADGSIILLIHFPHAAEPLPSFKAGQGFLSLQYTSIHTQVDYFDFLNSNDEL